MNNDKMQKEHNNTWWTFCKIKYEKDTERRKKELIIIPALEIALKVGDKYYLHDLKTIRRGKHNNKNIKVIEKYDFIPAGASKEQIEYYIAHIKKRNEKLNSSQI